MARSSVDDASVIASITVAQWPVVCNLKHCSSIGEVTSFKVSISHSNSSAIGKVPVSRSMCGIAGSAMNTDPTLLIVTWVDNCFVETIAMIPKLSNQGIIACAGISTSNKSQKILYHTSFYLEWKLLIQCSLAHLPRWCKQEY